MSKKYYFLIAVCIVLVVSCERKPMHIEKLHIDISNGNYTFVDTLSKIIAWTYIVDNFCKCDDDMRVLDSMVCSIMTEYPLYGYSIKFLKKNKISNIEHLQNFPRDLDPLYF